MTTSNPLGFLNCPRSYGDYSSGDHLFPFRTEKLSPLAQMVLHYNVEEYVVADLF